MAEATRDNVKVILSESKRQMQQLIYDKPVPNRMEAQIERKRKAEGAGRVFRPRKQFLTRKMKETAAGRKPAWKRTRNLSRKERGIVKTAYLGLIVNDASRKSKSGTSHGYSKARHYMKCRYPAPWRSNAVHKTAPIVFENYKAAMRSALMRGIGGTKTGG
jgi:hypothetical protein